MQATLGILSLGTALVLASAGELRAQEPRRSMPSPVPIMRAAHGLHLQDGVLRGGGADYKVAFDDAGMTFTPALGRRAPHSHPLRVTLVEIRRGETMLHDAVRAGAIRPRLDGRAAVYARGAGTDERFAVRADGVELSYVFARPLPGDGDLVVRLRVETELPVRVPGGGSGLRFAEDGLGGVRVGAVTGVDAADRRVRGALRCDGGYLELTLPDAFVDTATYPLVLDPLFGTEIAVGTGGWDDARPDGAWDGSTKHYLVAWQREFSATDVDIRAQRVDQQGALTGSLIFVHSPVSGVATRPSVGNVNGPNNFLVCWQEAPSVFGPWDVRGACVESVDGSVSASAAIAGSSANETDPDAASEHLEIAGDQTLVVWTEAGRGIRAARVACPGSSVAPTVTVTADVSSDPTDETPAISKQGGSRGQYLVTWRRPGAGIFAAYVTRGASVVGTEHRVADNLGNPEAPDVDGLFPDYLVVFQREELAFSRSNHDIRAQKVRWDAASASLVNVGAARDIANTGLEDEREPAVARYPGVYGIAWSEAQSGFLHYRIVLRLIDEESCASCGATTVLGGGGRVFDGAPQLIANCASGQWTDYRSLAVFMSASSTAPFASEARAQRFDAFGPGGAVTNQGGGCGKGGLARTNGPLAIGNRGFAFTLAQADPAASVGLFVIGTGAVIPCGACELVVPLVSFPVPVSNGSASFPLGLPCDPGLVGISFPVQWLVAGTAVSPCALGPTVSFSDRLQATIGI